MKLTEKEIIEYIKNSNKVIKNKKLCNKDIIELENQIKGTKKPLTLK